MANKSLAKAVIAIALSGGLIACSMFGPEYTLTTTGGGGGAGTEAVTAILASYQANGENNYRIDYLEQDPYLVNIYEGYGFAKDYTSAIAHNYTLEDVANTERPHPLANCLTCKTADFTKLVQELGVEAYSKSFDEVYPDMSENVGCYTCHGGEEMNGGALVLTHDYTSEKLGESGIDMKILTCGQCHIEYYFEPDTKATTCPYTDQAGMSPDAILAYYNEIGFADWTQESTGTKLLKAQHPEMETYLGAGSKHASMGLTCASCHMEKSTTESGVEYSNHSLVSPLANEKILESCAACHGETDMKEKVEAIQTEITARETEVGNALSEMKTKLAEANASGSYTEEQLEEIRDLHRSAQWYFDFDYVENSEGAHNSALAKDCLDKAMGFIEQANALLAGEEAPVEEEVVVSADMGIAEAAAALSGAVYGSDFGKTTINSAEVTADGAVVNVTNAEGFAGNITVNVAFAGDGSITAVDFAEMNETDGLGKRWTEDEVKGQFVGKNAAPYTLKMEGGSAADSEIDGVTGATFSSTAVVNAINAAADFFSVYGGGEGAAPAVEAPVEEAPAEEAPVESAAEAAAAEPIAVEAKPVAAEVAESAAVEVEPAVVESAVEPAEVESEAPAEEAPAYNPIADVMASYNANGDNSYTIDYLEQDPYLVDIYEGFGFAKDYSSARAHNYTLEDVAATERPHALANCLTCKTADFTKLVQELGVEAYSKTFDEVYPDMKENVGCYTCHGDSFMTGELVLTHDYTIDKLGESGINQTVLTCGQCHIEYYFEPETKATTTPYADQASMDPEAMLAYYDELGFADWTQESTGTKLLKAQHPEMETYLGTGSVHAGMGMSCADCHMEKSVTESGDTYWNHSLVSPLSSDVILESCAKCHGETDMKEKVAAIQADVTAKETETGNALAAMKNRLAEAVASGSYAEEQLDEIRALHRSAQWFFDFDYVENSEGAHNSTLAKKCLDKSMELIGQANGLLDSLTPVAESAVESAVPAVEVESAVEVVEVESVEEAI